MNEKKRALKDIFKVLVNNVISLLSGIMIGFVIPKIMGYEDYGYYKTFSLYYCYSSLLSFGIVDGVYLKYGGQKLSEINPSKIRAVVLFVAVSQAILSGTGILVSSLFAQQTTYGLVFVFVFLYGFLLNLKLLISNLFQATKEFTFPAVVDSANNILNIVCIGILYLLYKNVPECHIYFWYYCLIEVCVLGIDTLCFLIALRKKRVWTQNRQSFKSTWGDIVEYASLGFPLMIANLTSTFIMTVDKQVVSIFYPVENSNIFSIFSFAYSILALITTATNAVSTVLFPYMTGKDTSKLNSFFPKANTFILIFVSFACLIYFFLQWFVGAFLPKYNDSLIYLRTILPGLVIGCSVTVLMHNYYKTYKIEKVYFYQSLVILALAIATDLLTYYFYMLPKDPNNPVWLTVASDVTLLVWYIICEGYLIKRFKIRHWKNDFFALCSCSLFLLVAFFFDGWIGFGVYFGSIAILTLLFFFPEIKNGLKEGKQLIKKRKTNEMNAEEVPAAVQEQKNKEKKSEKDNN